MNTYRYSFLARCPSDGDLIRYRLTIVIDATIMAEDIVAACSTAEPVYHEDMADRLARVFGGEHTLAAAHRGVKIRTTRGSSR